MCNKSVSSENHATLLGVLRKFEPFFLPKKMLGGSLWPQNGLTKKMGFWTRTPGNFNSMPPAKESGGNFLSQEWSRDFRNRGFFVETVVYILPRTIVKFGNPRSPKTTFCPLVVGNHLHGSSLKTIRWYLLFGLGLPGGWCFFHPIPIGSTEKNRDWKIPQKVPEMFPKVWLNGDYTP